MAFTFYFYVTKKIKIVFNFIKWTFWEYWIQQVFGMVNECWDGEWMLEWRIIVKNVNEFWSGEWMLRRWMNVGTVNECWNGECWQRVTKAINFHLQTFKETLFGSVTFNSVVIKAQCSGEICWWRGGWMSGWVQGQANDVSELLQVGSPLSQIKMIRKEIFIHYLNW